MADKDVIERASILADFIASDFIKVARYLRELQEEKPELVLQVARLAGISNRKCYALIRISKQFDQHKIPEARLRRLGWTRLQLIGRYLKEDNVHLLLALSERYTVHDLEVLLRGDTPVENARVTTIYLSQDDHERFAEVLIANGAAKSGTGLIGVEEALMKLIDSHFGK